MIANKVGHSYRSLLVNLPHCQTISLPQVAEVLKAAELKKMLKQ